MVKESFLSFLLFLNLVTTICENFIIILWSDNQILAWVFTGIFLKIWSEPTFLEVNILWCTAF